MLVVLLFRDYYLLMPKGGKIIIRQDANVWPHELTIAKALARVGYQVEFKLSDNTHLSTNRERLNGISRLLFVNKHGQVFDIMNKKK